MRDHERTNVSEAAWEPFPRSRCGPPTRDGGRRRNKEDRTAGGNAQRVETHLARPSRLRPSCCVARTCRRPLRVHLASLVSTTSREQARPARCPRAARPDDRHTSQGAHLSSSKGRSMHAKWRDQETRERESNVRHRGQTAQLLQWSSSHFSAAKMARDTLSMRADLIRPVSPAGTWPHFSDIRAHPL